MWLFIQQIIQLVLSPARGWEDISAAVRAPQEIERRGFLPWIGIVGLSQFVRLFYEPELSFFTALLMCIGVAGALFASLFMARLFLDLTIMRQDGSSLSVTKVNVVSIYVIALEGLYVILTNVVPASMTFLHFLPLISLLVVFRSARFVGVPQENIITYLGLCTLSLIVLPIVMEYLLTILI